MGRNPHTGLAVLDVAHVLGVALGLYPLGDRKMFDERL